MDADVVAVVVGRRSWRWKCQSRYIAEGVQRSEGGGGEVAGRSCAASVVIVYLCSGPALPPTDRHVSATFTSPSCINLRHNCIEQQEKEENIHSQSHMQRPSCFLCPSPASLFPIVSAQTPASASRCLRRCRCILCTVLVRRTLRRLQTEGGGWSS